MPVPENIPLALYVHLPWCVRKCPYCDFNSHAAPARIPEDDYLAALLADLRYSLPAVDGRQFRTVYFGGGTPSLFKPASIGSLLEALQRDGLLADDAEITLEANPGTVDEQRFAGFRRAGVNRLSLGVQSFDDRQLQALGRIHDAADARAATEVAARHFDNFNLDLMYGLPDQTPAAAGNDVAAAIASGATHLSCYQLTLEPNTVFHKFPPVLPDETVQAEIERVVEAGLLAAGYQHYEVSAHAVAGGESQHNLNYWRFGDYLGLGAGAHSKLTSADVAVSGATTLVIERTARVRVPENYMRRAGTTAVIAERKLPGPADLLFEFMLNAMRLRDGFDLDLLSARTGLAAEVAERGLEQAQLQGLLERPGRRVLPSPAGRLFLNRIIAEFLPET